ncbi:hypothetical protein ACFY3V_12215 [Streptosporangium sp. NPDC000095]|uniref:hypothetical protein n=1 Tax=Streptosporangium sp. NPDC000095 TaxID=3366184 RepID=UPI00368BC93A
MLKNLLVSAALVGSALIAPAAVALPASAATLHAQTPAVSAGAHAACQYRQDKQVWRCITPGAFCPKAARGKYGYAKVTNRKYRCLYKNSDPYWRWRRA